MENTINFGIDLGTTNSAIAKFTAGEVKVFKNPTGWKETLPSVVGFRKDKILVGEQARVFQEKDPKSVVGTFKRKMGTTESFKIKSINESKTPVELSAFVLKELKTFLPPNETLESVVITIPASFDMVQSNATKEAGIQAGFKQVVLLQEPIAASMAYANMKKENEIKDGQWLVYDLGGGTFDVALMRIKEGDMSCIDHEGDNFLGGADFDRLIVERLVLPKLEEKYSFGNLENDMKSASGKYNGKFLALVMKAENAKILLSAKSSAEIVVDGMEDDNGDQIDEEIVITRSEFNELIKSYVDDTIDMIKKILTRNSLKPTDIQFTLMVGGSTYIPYVRQRVEEVLQIPINCEIDPTTAVAVGAAYYAATKPKQAAESSKPKKQTRISIKHSCPTMSREKDILFAAKVSGDINGLFYRIKRKDGGFDSGLKKLTERINEDLPLVDNAYNYFELTVYDAENNVIETDLDLIGINSGFVIGGQPLSEDICLEIDDDDIEGETKLFPIFYKNSPTPTKRTTNHVLKKTIVKGSDDVIRIHVLEGPSSSLPEANKTVGYIEISGKNLKRDVSKGSDIELSFSLGESKDLTVSAYLNMADQEFKGTFSPKERHTPVNVLKLEVENLTEKLVAELDAAEKSETYEVAAALSKIKKEMESVAEETEALTDDDTTDKRYQLEDKKRKLAQAIFSATKDKMVNAAKEKYEVEKADCFKLLEQVGNDYDQKIYYDIVNQEPTFLSSNSVSKIDEFTSLMLSLYWSLWSKHPEEQKKLFSWLRSQKSKMNDPQKADGLVISGDLAIKTEDWSKLSEISRGLMSLLPKNVATPPDKAKKIGF
ncbi:MAG: Hsp70 family protein [Chitinophagales bacterium]